jgi:hypothetical protein
MKFTDSIPTINGYYWERRNNNTKIIEINTKYPPTHWKERRDRLIDSFKLLVERKELEEVVYQDILNKSDKHWVIEWAGPILPPNE